MRNGKTLILAILSVTLAAGSPPAGAAVFDVPAGDVGGLIAAIDAANANGEADTIQLEAGSYTLTSEESPSTGLPEITSEIAIVGAGAGSTVLDRGGVIVRFLRVAVGGHLRVEGVTLSGGRTIALGEFGGAIRSNGALTVVDCALTGNQADVASAIHHVTDAGAPLVIEGSTFSGNVGGSVVRAVGPFRMTGSQIVSNPTDAIYWVSASHGVAGTGVIQDSTIQDNAEGVRVFAEPDRAGIFEVVRSTIDANDGIGLLLSGNALRAFVTDSTISNNTSTFQGAGIYASATLVLRRSTVSGNTTLHPTVGGGGIAVGGDVTIENSTISGNSARAAGGGIYLFATLPKRQGVHVRASTITGNQSDSDASGVGGGGGIAAFGDGFEIEDTIVAGNSDGGASGNDCAGDVVSKGHNLLGDTTGCSFAATTGDVTGVPALLGPLAANGGPTATHEPLAGSPAIDAADPRRCGAPDQRFFDRQMDGGGTGDGCDIGSVEVGAVAVVFLSDAFLCYGAANAPGTPSLPAVAGVGLADANEAKLFDVKKTKALCTPADADGQGIADAGTHLHGRLIRESAGWPPHAPLANVKLVNALGAFTVHSLKADRLLVPAAKGLTSFPPAPDGMAHDVDRYKCYTAKASTAGAPFPKGSASLRVAVGDPFTSGRVLRLNKVTRFCTSVDMNGLGQKNPFAHLVCYQARAEKPLVAGDVERTIKGLYASSEWGDERVDAKRSVELCLPSLRF